MKENQQRHAKNLAIFTGGFYKGTFYENGVPRRGNPKKGSQRRKRMEDIKRVPEWQALKGRENRYPNQFGGIGDNGDGTPTDIPFRHVNGNGEALVVPGVNCLPDAAVVFPMETGEPLQANVEALQKVQEGV